MRLPGYYWVQERKFPWLPWGSPEIWQWNGMYWWHMNFENDTEDSYVDGVIARVIDGPVVEPVEPP